MSSDAQRAAGKNPYRNKAPARPSGARAEPKPVATSPGPVARLPGDRAVYWTLFGYCFISFVRPQDFLPALDVARPGLAFSIAMLLAWFGTKNRDYLADAIPKLFIAFLLLIAAGGIFAVNRHRLLWTVEDVAAFGLAFFLAVPAALRSYAHRRTMVRFLLLTNMFTAAWVITHHGHGQGGQLGDENDVAVALDIGVCLCFAAARFDATKFWRRLATAGIFLCVVAVIFTNSRGGFLGLVAAGAAVAIFSRQFLRTVFSIAIVVLLVLPFVPDSYTARLHTISDSTNNTRRERIYGWNRGMDMFRANPIFGVGVANFPARVWEFEHSEAATTERNDHRSLGGRAAHSLYFTLLPETGLVGAVLYFCMLGAALRRSWTILQRPLPDAPGDDRRLWAYFIGSALVAFSVGGAFISVLFYPHFWMLAGFAILLSPLVEMSDGNIRWVSPTKTAAAAQIRGGDGAAPNVVS